MSVASAIVAVASILLFLAFYWLVIADGRTSGLGVATATVCLLAGLALMPIWGPVAVALEARARDLARAELSSAPSPRVGAAWWLEQTVTGLGVIVRRLYLGIAVAIVTGVLVFLPARHLGVAGWAALEAWSFLHPFVAVGLVSAFSYLETPSKRRVFRLRDAVRAFPRFAGFCAGMTLLWCFPLVNVFAPTVGAVAWTLWNADRR